jgi:phosphoglycolate phosphatase
VSLVKKANVCAIIKDRMAKHLFHTIIFDLDGTLSDTAILTMDALTSLAPLYDLEVPSREVVTEAMGYETPEFFYRLFPGAAHNVIDPIGPLIDQGEIDALKSKKESLLFEGCLELLEKLKEEGVRLYIVSTGTKDHVDSILRETEITDFFDMVYCECADKTDAIRQIVNGEDTNGFVFVGDMIKDYVAARQNGVLSVGACYGYCKRESADFDLYIDHPFDLLDILHGLGGFVK